jgi:hypothetical protein
VLPAYLLLTALGASTGQARAGVVLAWLAAHALIAWTLRTQPTLSWKTNPAFPVSAALAVLVGLAAALTPAGALVHLDAVSLAWLAIIVLGVLAATIAAWFLTHTRQVSQRL